MILQARADVADFAASQASPPDNSGHPDRELQRRVHNFLQNRRLPRSSSVKVEAHNGVVTLRGSHRSFYHKQLCISCAQRVAGVVRLIDATKVLPAH
jgi:osmotically-inducible protein OsmY